MKKYAENFGAVFEKAMMFNLSIINETKEKKGVLILIGDYIKNYILVPNNILDNIQLNFAFFYERREREYGLS